MTTIGLQLQRQVIAVQEVVKKLLVNQMIY